MGQRMQVLSTTVLGTVAIFSTDRGVTGQAGAAFTRGEEAGGFPAGLAAEVFAADEGIDHVFVASNQVVAGRPDGWDDALLESVSAVISGFFVFYGEG